MTLPVLNLDLLGTLIPTGKHHSFGEPVVRIHTDNQRLWAHRRVLGRIVAVHEQNLAEVRILTDRPQTAHDLLAALGLPAWTVSYPASPTTTSDHWWKETVVREDLDAGRTVAWIDDEIIERAHDRDLHLAYPGRILTISPRASRGVTLGGLDRVRDWLIAQRDATTETLTEACA